MKRILSFILLSCLLLTSCGQKAATSVPAENAPTWQEQYDLGIRYLSEGNYEEAIIAFTAAIEIDPRQVDAYIGLADVYTAQDNIDKAREILEQALAIIGEQEAISAALSKLGDNVPGDQSHNALEYPEHTLNYRYDENGAVKFIDEDLYDAQGILVRSNTYNNKWELLSYVIWTEWKENHQGYSCTVYDADDSFVWDIVETWEGTDCITTLYDQEGNIIDQFIHRYDDEFNLLSEEHYDAAI